VKRACLCLGLACLTATLGPAAAAEPAAAGTISALRDEVLRAKSSLRLPGLPAPHYVSANLLAGEHMIVEATLGTLLARSRRHDHTLQALVRVGDARFDSGNFLGNESPVQTSGAAIEHDYGVVRHGLWLLLDSAFKAASSTYEAKRAERLSQANKSESLFDFSPAPAVREIVPGRPPPLDVEGAAALARNVSAALRGYPELFDSGVTILGATEERYFVTSEGSEIAEPSELLEIVIWARSQADDGMGLAHFVVFHAPRVAALPSEAKLVSDARRMAEELIRLRQAPVVDDYGGPVLFEGIAAPQLLRVLLAEEFSGTPPPEAPGGASLEGSSLATRVGWKVLPTGVDVTDDPGSSELAGAPLIGGYRFDDEGVRATRVELVKDGKLLRLLMSRTPSKRFTGSTGHARGGISGWARARPTNLLVGARRGMSQAALRARLLAEVRSERLPYGMIVRQLDEPRLTANVLEQERTPSAIGPALPRPILAYRLYPDGREELLRGATLQSLGVRDLRYLLGVGATPTVWSYFSSSSPLPGSGAASGDIPTSMAAPDLLVRDLDVRRPSAPHRRPPSVPRPVLRELPTSSSARSPRPAR
jgi:TldD protein